MRHFLVVIMLFVSCINSNAGIVSECIYSQKQFDRAIARINKGEEMKLILHRGEYLLKDSLNAIAPITIEGRKAIITCAHSYCSNDAIKTTEDYYIYRITSPITTFPVFYDARRKTVPVSESVLVDTGVNYIEGDIYINGGYSAGTQIRIPIPSSLNHLTNKLFSRAFGYLDSGWGVVDFKLEKADERFIYCTTINSCSTKNYMYDREVYRKKVRFVIYNAEIKKDAIYYDSEYLYVPRNISKVYCICESDSSHQCPSISFKSDVILKKVRFEGCPSITINSKKSNTCQIQGCFFDKSFGSAVVVKKENGVGVEKVSISSCDFYECGMHSGAFVQILTTFAATPCVDVYNCRMTRYPSGWAHYKNTGSCIWVDGDVNVFNNVIYNTCRDHIFLHAGQIVVKGNVIYNSDEFNSHIDRNLSGDWGLIYCGFLFSNTEDAINNKDHIITLENNLLYGAQAYTGDARGIFIDDGRGDIICRNNIVLNTQIFSIDARNSKINDVASIRNKYENNIVTNKYRLTASEKVAVNNQPVIKGNKTVIQSENVVANAIVQECDEQLDVDISASCGGGKIRVSKGLLSLIKQSPAWKDVRHYLSK